MVCTMNGEPLTCGFNRQQVLFEFYPSSGLLMMECIDGNYKYNTNFDMKDVFFLHGWLGSAIMHYMESVKTGKGKHSKEMRKIMKAAKILSDTKMLELEHQKEKE